ncbi:hypothetical protein PV326_001262 [Microctonus aethiopoides]|nr:hypothetical protein PV326_001262 [Microctonus aethiopoides]
MKPRDVGKIEIEGVVQVCLDKCFLTCKWEMGKDQELLEAARNGNVTIVEKILGQRAKRSGPLARWV